MRVVCIKGLENSVYYHQTPSDYLVNEIYFVDKIYKGKDMIFGSEETYYVIRDNYNQNHTFNKLGFEQHFTTISKERKNKLEKILRK